MIRGLDWPIGRRAHLSNVEQFRCSPPQESFLEVSPEGSRR